MTRRHVEHPLPDRPGIALTRCDLEVGISLHVTDFGEADCEATIQWIAMQAPDRPDAARLKAAVDAFFAALYLPEQDTGT